MSWISKELSNAMSVVGIAATELDPAASKSIRDRILSRYAAGRTEWPTWIWEHLPDRFAVYDPKGWEFIEEFSLTNPVIMFFNINDESSAFLFESGADAVRILAECFNFEVYFTDAETSYLMIHNHHDCVIACGRAKEWMEMRARE